jgi:hypothetical protein
MTQPFQYDGRGDNLAARRHAWTPSPGFAGYSPDFAGERVHDSVGEGR